MKKLIVLAGILLTLTGCSTTPITTGDAGSIPVSRIYNPAYFTKTSEQQVEVSFQRDKGFIGSGCSHDIYVNNIKIFSIRPNESAVIYLNPDYYILAMRNK